MATEGERLAAESLLKARVEVEKEQKRLDDERKKKEKEAVKTALEDLKNTMKKYVPNETTGDDSPPPKGDPALMHEAKKLIEAARHRPLTLDDHLAVSKLKERFSKLTD
jgi:succinate dehydrogenase/fumarate reductase flavoprotein subunit